MYLYCLITSVLLQRIFNGNLELAYDFEQAKNHAEDMASTDVLSGLNNRRAFFDKADLLFANCKRSQEPISALMLDTDHFKKLTTAMAMPLVTLLCVTLHNCLKPICTIQI